MARNWFIQPCSNFVVSRDKLHKRQPSVFERYLFWRYYLAKYWIIHAGRLLFHLIYGTRARLTHSGSSLPFMIWFSETPFCSQVWRACEWHVRVSKRVSHSFNPRFRQPRQGFFFSVIYPLNSIITCSDDKSTANNNGSNWPFTEHVQWMNRLVCRLLKRKPFRRFTRHAFVTYLGEIQQREWSVANSLARTTRL